MEATELSPSAAERGRIDDVTPDVQTWARRRARGRRADVQRHARPRPGVRAGVLRDARLHVPLLDVLLLPVDLLHAGIHLIFLHAGLHFVLLRAGLRVLRPEVLLARR